MIQEEIENEYFEWLYELVCGKRFAKQISYRKLLAYLHSTEFIYILARDENRAEDGKQLRYRFALQYDSLDLEDYLDGPCSVLEMMAALAVRCEEDYMDDPNIGDRTRQWFWGMIANLGLGAMMDDRFDKEYVDKVVTRFLNRQYRPDGEGGLFRVRNCKYDMRDIEIWGQLCFYLNTII